MLPANSFLPESFEPTVTEVVVGRGKRIAQHVGNQRLRDIVRSHLTVYSAANSKREKSEILSNVVLIVRRDSSYQQAGFVKQDGQTGRWIVVEDSAARITVAQAFRDALHINYKSSKQYKQQRRQKRKTTVVKSHTNNKEEEQQVEKKVGTFYPAAAAVQQAPLLQLLDVDRLVPECWSTGSSFVPESNINSSNSSNDFLWSLYGGLEGSLDLTEDPFEPTPLAEDVNALQSTKEGTTNSPPSWPPSCYNTNSNGMYTMMSSYYRSSANNKMQSDNTTTTSNFLDIYLGRTAIE